jgi:hypothetical protein
MEKIKSGEFDKVLNELQETYEKEYIEMRDKCKNFSILTDDCIAIADGL